MKDSRDNVNPPLSEISLCEGGVTFEIEGEELVFYIELKGISRKKFATMKPGFFGPSGDVGENLKTITDAMHQVFKRSMQAQGHTVISERRQKDRDGE